MLIVFNEPSRQVEIWMQTKRGSIGAKVIYVTILWAMSIS
jgi:hypothetical protein